MKISLRSSLMLLALLATVSTASAQTPTWTIQPVLKRLDTNDNELASGQVDVRNSDTLRIGVYFRLTKSASSSNPVGYEGVPSANVYFTSGGLSNASVSTVVASIATGTLAAGASPSAETAAGFYQRWTRTQVYGGLNAFSYSPDPTNRRWNFGFDEGLSTDNPKGVYCAASELTCDVFFGVLVVPLSNLANSAVGSLSMKIAGTTISSTISGNPLNNGGTAAYGESNTISYFVCPSTGCPVTATFASNAYSVEEGSMVDVTVDLSETYSGSITIPIAARTTGTGAGSAPTTAYTLPSPSSVTFAAGETTQTFQVTADDNADDSTATEPPQATQTLVLDFGALPGTVVAGGTTSTTVTITDDDFPSATVAFGAASYAATEGGSAAQVAVTLTAPASPNTLEREVVVPITTTLAGGASNADFSGVQTGQTLTFAPSSQGATTQTITVTALDDNDGTCGTCTGTADINESITLGFGDLPKDMSAGTQSTTSVSLQDNDSDRVDLAVSVSSLGEGDSATNVTVTGTLRVNSVSALASAITVSLGTSGSATSGAGNDYTITTDNLIFAVGATSGAEVMRTLSVTPNDDSVVENVETIVITGTPAGILSGVTDATPINLNDNDTATVSIAAPAVGVSEGTDGAGQSDTASAAFTATLSAQVATAVTVAWSAGTDGVAGTDDADPDADLVAKSGSIVFAADSAAMTAQTISVSIENDEDSEDDEVFRVTLGAITGAPPARSSVPTVTVHGSNGFADATILKNDPLTVALEAPPKLLEGRVAQYTLRVLDGTSTQPVEATVTAAIDSQVTPPPGYSAPTDTGCPANADFCQEDGTAFPISPNGVVVTISAGQATETFELRIADDGRGDENEEVTVTISSVQGGRSSASNTDGISAAPTSPAQPGGPVSVATTSISEALAVSVDADAVTDAVEEGGTFTIPVLVDDQPESGDTLTVRYELVPGADPLSVYARAVAADYVDESGGSVTIGAEHCGASANPDGGCRTSITVSAVDDELSEVAEGFSVRLTGVTVNSARANAREAVVADDADTAALTIAASDPVVVAWEPPPFLREGRLAEGTIRVTGVDGAPAVSTAPIVLDVHVCFPTCSGGESALAAASAGSSAPAPASHGGPEDAVLVDGDTRLPIPVGGLMHRTTIPAGVSEKILGIDVHRDEEDDDDEQIGLWFTNVAGGRGVDRTVTGEEPPADDPQGIMFSDEVPQNLGEVAPLQIKQVFLVAINTEGAEALLAVDEGGEFRIPVEVDDALDEGVTLTVTYTVEPDPESRGAGAGDYSDPAEGSVLITGPGATPGTLIRITAVDDNLSEAQEAFTVTLTGVASSNPDLVAAELDEPRKTTPVTIAASDPLTVSFTGPPEAREKTTATYTVSLGGGVSTADVVVPIVLNPEAPGRGALPAADAADVDGLPDTVTVAAGQSSRTFDLDIVREPGSAREGKEYLVLELGSELTGGGGGGLVASRDADSVGTVITEVNLEERGKAMKYTLAAFGRTVASGMVSAIEGRVAASRSAGGSQMTLAGEDLSLSAFGLEGEDADAEAEAAAEALRKMERLLGLSTDDAGGMSLDPVSSRELLTGSSFDLSLHGERDRAGSWSAWGHGSAARFEGEPENRFSMKGDVLSGYVGLDSRVREDMLAGVALNLSTGDTDYSFTEGTKGTIDTTLTSVHPYVHWSPVPSVGLWATLGIGQGDATLDDGDSEPVTTDVRMRMGATGARAELGEWQSIDWAMKADAFLVRLESEEREDLLPAVEADAHRLRWLLEGSRSVELASGAGLTGTFELGTRLDGGDGDEGGGAEVGGGVTYGHPETGLDLSARGRAVVSHTASGFKEWGLGFSAAYDPGVPGRGLHMSVEPAWGNAASGMNSLWEETARSAKVSETDSDDEARQPDPDMALAAEAGYGLGLMNERGLLTPFGALNLSNEHSGVRLGTRLSLEARRDTDLDLSVYGEREGSSTDAAQYSVVFDSRVGRGLWEGAGTAEVFSKLAVGAREDYQVGVRIRLRF